MKGSTRQIPGASFIWSCFVQNRAFILCPLKCDFRPLDIAWQPCVRLPRNIATRSRFYSRRSANTYPSLKSDHKNDPYHGKTGQHALTSNKIFFSKSPVFAVHRGIVRHLPAEHKIQSLPVRIPPSPPKTAPAESRCCLFFPFFVVPLSGKAKNRAALAGGPVLLSGVSYFRLKKAFLPGYCAASPSSSSMRSSWLYLATRSVRLGAPVLIWPAFRATAMSAMVASSVSPER